MINQSTIEHAVMRRIYVIRVLRPLCSGTSVSVLLLLSALWGIGREVWVASVLHNAPANFTDLPRFYLAAFGNTRLVVQALSVLTLASVVYLARETARIIMSVLVPSRA